MLTPPTYPAFVFPRWSNRVPGVLLAALGGTLGGAVLGIWFYFSPRHTDVGYAPEQPLPYSHKLHAGDLGIDCRYCHVSVERSAVASVPPTQVCMNCHLRVRPDSPRLAVLRKSWAEGTPVPWVRVHKVADYVYFNHSSHVSRGVGCVECHGHIEQMVRVRQHQPLSMGWCLSCHRAPAGHVRPPSQITEMDWDAPRTPPDQPLEEARAAFGKHIVERDRITPGTDCSTCHR
jgi:hypothetical protein